MRHKWIFAAVVAVVGLFVIYLLAQPSIEDKRRREKAEAFADSLIRREELRQSRH